MGEQEPTLLSSLDLASVRTVLADEFPWLPLHSLTSSREPHPVPHSRRRNNRMVDHPGARGGQRRVPISLSTNRKGGRRSSEQHGIATNYRDTRPWRSRGWTSSVGAWRRSAIG